jgi:uncharacterized membrane protein YoaK (UPF0700 family)
MSVTHGLRRRARIEPDLGCMLVLTFSTGIADAVGYLGLDRVFTGNMTGNVVILGMAVGGADDLPVAGPAVALGAFMLGAVIGGRVLRRAVGRWPGRVSILLGAVAGMFALSALVLALFDLEERHDVQVVLAGVLATAMGIQAAAARYVGVKDVTTVVVTSTITGLSADSRLAGGSGQAWPRRGGAVLLISAGALAGALLLRIGLAAGISTAAVLVGLALLWGHTARSDVVPG